MHDSYLSACGATIAVCNRIFGDQSVTILIRFFSAFPTADVTWGYLLSCVRSDT